MFQPRRNGTQWDWYIAELVHYGTSTQWDWASIGLVHKGTGTLWDWYTMGLGPMELVYNGTGTLWNWDILGQPPPTTSVLEWWDQCPSPWHGELSPTHHRHAYVMRADICAGKFCRSSTNIMNWIVGWVALLLCSSLCSGKMPCIPIRQVCIGTLNYTTAADKK